jgi:uncharacterized protein (TIGR02001 family)
MSSRFQLKKGTIMMKSKLLTSLILAAMAAPGVAMAEEASPFTANVGIVSDYLYRGISQTGTHPALQGGFDYAHSSGFYAGVWGSSISWISDAGLATNAGVELDTYFGFRNSFAEDFTYDVGFLRYNYPGSYIPPAIKADTDEIYGAIGYKWVTAKYSYSLGDTFATADADGTDYIEINASVPLTDTGITVGAHVGKQSYKGPNAGAGVTDLSYTDYKLSVSKDFNGYVVGLAYSDTDASAIYTVLGKELGKGTAVLSLTHAF